jgi:hypothetical protein
MQDIEKVAQSLVRKYEASKVGHAQQVTVRENAMSICKAALP